MISFSWLDHTLHQSQADSVVFLRYHPSIREVICPKRAQRRRGKSDPIDAYAAASQVLAEAEDLPSAKTSDGPGEQVGMLKAVRRSAVKARVAAHRQITSLLATAPEPTVLATLTSRANR